MCGVPSQLWYWFGGDAGLIKLVEKCFYSFERFCVALVLHKT